MKHKIKCPNITNPENNSKAFYILLGGRQTTIKVLELKKIIKRDC